VFVDASSIRSDIGAYSFQYYLAVGFAAGKPPAILNVYLVDEPLVSFCQSSRDDSPMRGYFTSFPSSARDMRDHLSVEVTPVALQLTRRSELVRGGERGWGWGGQTPTHDRNSYRAEVTPKIAFDDSTILAFPETAYPVLALQNISSVRAQWTDEAYRTSTVTPLIKVRKRMSVARMAVGLVIMRRRRMIMTMAPAQEFWRDNDTNSYYFHLSITQYSEVVTYTQHDPVDPMALLGIYCK
jgi:hypothetical protein